MVYDAVIHGRRPLRLRGYDYTQQGAYYVTVVTWKRVCLFGDVVQERMELNRVGEKAAERWKEIPRHAAYVKLDTFVVMPNHVHGILVFEDGHREGIGVGAQHAAPLQNGSRGPRQRSLGAIVRSFKSAVTKSINEGHGAPGAPVWQRNFYEHVVRNEDELNRIRQYIEENPARWEEDDENPGFLAKAL